MARRNRRACESTATVLPFGTVHHSRDLVTVYCGRTAPVTLCGYHAQDYIITESLASIPVHVRFDK